MCPEVRREPPITDGLIYVHDPMCSWCWAFRPALEHLVSRLPDDLKLYRVIGGLAPDTPDPMPAAMRRHLSGIWRIIEREVPGTRFNHRFWETCVPRRSTFPACRAVIAARSQGESWDSAMTLGIQKAYYLEAKNPSDDTVLVAVARSVGLDVERFRSDFHSARTREILEREIDFSRFLGIAGFPAVLLRTRNRNHPIAVDYGCPDHMITAIQAILQGA